jgi:putative iron-regulated protein
MSKIRYVALLVLHAPVAASIQNTSGTEPSAGLARRITRAYANYSHAIYTKCIGSADKLRLATDTFLESPTEKTLKQARRAWIRARGDYGQTEVLRFYNGPIDNGKDGPETLLNAWPLDEAYIDIVRDSPRGGILQDRKHYPNLNSTILSLANERGGEANICVGWHAVEFMLWGQDFYKDGPGRRSHRQFLDAHDKDADRRREYLGVLSTLIVKQVRGLQAAWKPKQNNYRKSFEAKPRDAIRKMLTGMVVLSGFEMAGERMAVAYETKDQEEEHSCFSDTTHQDLIANQLGIVALYRGTGPGMDGVGLRDLAKTKDAELAAAIDRQLDRSLKSLRAIPKPFDQAILGKDDSKGRRAVLAAMTALETQTDLLAALGLALGYRIPIRPSGK